MMFFVLYLQKIRAMTREPNIPNKPRAGVYGDPDVYEAYKDLYLTLHAFMNDNQDMSYGNLSLGGVASMIRAKSSAIIQKAKILDTIIKAVCTGRR